MTKAVTQPKATPPAVAEENALEELMRQHAGKGVSTRAADNITPQIDIMQPLSPLVNEGKAKAGDIILNNAPDPLVDHFWFQPAWTTEAWFRFHPREAGGGFVNRWQVTKDWPRFPAGHPFAGEPRPPDGATQTEDRKCTFPDGDTCIHYRHVAGIVWRNKSAMQFVLPFKSSGHTIYKKWNGKMMAPITDKRGSLIPPAFAGLYHITTFIRKNKLGLWYLPNIGDRVLLSEERAKEIVGDTVNAGKIGLALANAFESGELVEATPEQDSEQSDDAM